MEGAAPINACMHSSVFPLLVEFALTADLVAVDDDGIALSQTRSSRSVGFLLFFTIITDLVGRTNFKAFSLTSHA